MNQTIDRSSDGGFNAVDTLGGHVVVRTYNAEGRVIDVYRLTPDRAVIFASLLTESAKKADTYAEQRREEDRRRFQRADGLIQTTLSD